MEKSKKSEFPLELEEKISVITADDEISVNASRCAQNAFSDFQCWRVCWCTEQSFQQQQNSINKQFEDIAWQIHRTVEIDI